MTVRLLRLLRLPGLLACGYGHLVDVNDVAVVLRLMRDWDRNYGIRQSTEDLLEIFRAEDLTFSFAEGLRQ
jgi:hypothetical protein